MENGTVPAAAKRKQPPGGSRKGIPNKVNADLKAMILGALDEAGGVSYLVDRAHDPKTAAAFLTLVGKVLPMTVQGPASDGGFVLRVERIDMDAVAKRNA